MAICLHGVNLCVSDSPRAVFQGPVHTHDMGSVANLVERERFCAGDELIHLDDLPPSPHQPWCCPVWGPGNETIMKYSLAGCSRWEINNET